VVRGREGAIGPPQPPAGEPQGLERLRRGDLVNEVEVDVEERLGDLVRLPDLVE
jgi:hypothetical protein